MWILWLILAVIAVLLFYQYGIVRRRLPPGPFPLPLAGNTLALRGVDRWEEKFLEWRQKYGPVYTFFSGPLAIVTVNDLDLMQQVDGDTYNEKFKMKALFELTRGGNYGLVATDGDLWREQRRFALRTLRDFGLGKDEMSRRILEEVQYLCSTINRQLEGGTAEFENFHKLTDIAVGSVINSVLAGYRFTDGKEEEFYKLKQTLDKVMKSFADPFVLMGILSDWLRGLPVFKQRVGRSIALMNEIFDFMRSVVDKHEHQNDYETMEEPADFIDAFLMEKNKLDKAGESHYFSRIQLLNACLDI
ncbi:Unspecific monooxygenase [Aphelenchoides fujianensis]|nr:Unspecific monooxygenase [Aphelenchoides fujianensis]